jgi:hypothetical protein
MLEGLAKAVVPGLVIWSLGVTVGGVWWASDLTTRMRGVESAGNPTATIARLEQRVDSVDKALDKIDTKIDRLIERSLRNRPGNDR